MDKPIIVQGAMKIELEYIKNVLAEIEELNIDGYKFIRGKINGYPVILSETQIGSINATMSTAIGIKEFKPLYIINQGVAGGQTSQIKKNDLVIGNGCINTNSYETNKRKVGEGSNPLEWKIINFTSDDSNENEIQTLKSDIKLFNLAQSLSDKYSYGKVHTGVLGSGDSWDKEADKIIALNKKTGILSADMESIGTYTVANKYNVPVIGIRTISDNAILNEDYERIVAHGSQEFVLKLIEKIIEDKEV